MAASDHYVTIVTRVGCHLCEQVETDASRLSAELGFGLELLDVDADPDRRTEYGERVPVILIDGKEHGYWELEETRFRQALSR